LADRLMEINLVNASNPLKLHGGKSDDPCEELTLPDNQLVDDQFQMLSNPFECNHTVAGTAACLTSLTAFEEHARSELEGGFKDLITLKVEYWNQLNDSCLEQTTNNNLFYADLSEQVEEFERISQECQGHAQNRNDDLCLGFQPSYQGLCGDIADFQVLEAKVRGKGTTFSSQDREEEFNTTAIVKCSLQSYLSTGVAPADDVVDNCAAGIIHLGDINLPGLDAVTVSCQETHFTFSDRTWAQPSPEPTFLRKPVIHNIEMVPEEIFQFDPGLALKIQFEPAYQEHTPFQFEYDNGFPVCK